MREDFFIGNIMPVYMLSVYRMTLLHSADPRGCFTKAKKAKIVCAVLCLAYVIEGEYKSGLNALEIIL